MLKLIHSFDMKVDNVKNYYDSFGDKIEDLNCYGINRINQSAKEYIDDIRKHEKNLYYLIHEENPNYIIGFGSIEDSGFLITTKRI